MKHGSMTVDLETRNDHFEDVVANLVAECREIIRERLMRALSAVSGELLAEQIWRGSIEPRGILQALLGLERLQAFQAELSAELGSLAAGVFSRPVLLRVTAGQGVLSEEMAEILGEQLAWGRQTRMLNSALKEACHLVWNRAAGDLAWPLRSLQPGKLLWRLLDTTPADEERRCLQELTRSVEGVRVSMQERLFRTISLQAAEQIWSLYDDLSQQEISGVQLNPEKCPA
jgi:hypothetical protein